MKTIKFINSELLLSPKKIVCVGKNYAAHAAEMGGTVPIFPIIFLKPVSNLISKNEVIVHPKHSNEMHHEVELVIAIGRTIKNAGDKTAEEAIAGYAVGLDMTLRDLQREAKEKGHPWTLAKCFDTAAVVSDFVAKENFNLTMNEKITLSVNGELRQNSTLNKMVFSPVEIIKYISARMTLEEGDLIFTGTPEGVGKVVPGDTIEAGIENIDSFKIDVV